MSPTTFQVFGFFHSCDRHEGNVSELVMNVTGTFHNDAMLRQITEAAMIITPHSLYHLFVNILRPKCLFVCLFVFFFTFSAINGLQNLAPPCRGTCKKYSMKNLVFSVNVGSGIKIT